MYGQPLNDFIRLNKNLIWLLNILEIYEDFVKKKIGMDNKHECSYIKERVNKLEES